ncbi:MAG: hypothetical protein ACKOFH_04825, partial [Chthoniobacterales bacterium]
VYDRRCHKKTVRHEGGTGFSRARKKMGNVPAVIDTPLQQTQGPRFDGPELFYGRMTFSRR